MRLLEREPYLTELGGLLRQSGSGQGSLVFLGGEVGVGKTALVRQFREATPPETRVLLGYCDPLSTPRPLGPLLDIAADLDGALEPLAVAAAPRHRLFSAFLAELSRGHRPTLAVIEDVHWADEATLDLLRFLGRRLGSAHGLVIATYRNDEIGPTHPLQLVLGDLATAPAVRRLTLVALSVAGVRMLAEGSGQDPAVLHRQTGGNPFFVTEVLAPFALQMAGKSAEAAACWRALGCPYEAAWALADRGDESSLREAHAALTRLGAAPAATLVTRRLQELGARGIPRGPRPTTRANPAFLTPRELEVLVLMGEGMANAEIADRLYLSPRTVAHHVSSILVKLGVHSRAEAVRESARLGIVIQIGLPTGPK